MIPFRTKSRVIDLLGLKPEDICIEDIAASLSGIRRFNGLGISVAQHSLICAQMADDDEKFELINHDDHEYILGDISYPSADFMMRWAEGSPFAIVHAKRQIDFAIESAFDIDFYRSRHAINEIDNRVRATEMMSIWGENYTDYQPYDIEIVRMSQEEAERAFLDEFYRLSALRKKQ